MIWLKWRQLYNGALIYFKNIFHSLTFQTSNLPKRAAKNRGWARFCYSSGILDSRCFRRISWMHTFFWINWGIIRPVQPVFLILCWSWTESLQHEKGNIWNKCTSSYSILLVKLFNTNKCIQESESNCKDAKHLNQETKYFIQ